MCILIFFFINRLNNIRIFFLIFPYYRGSIICGGIIMDNYIKTIFRFLIDKTFKALSYCSFMIVSKTSYSKNFIIFLLFSKSFILRTLFGPIIDFILPYIYCLKKSSFIILSYGFTLSN